MRVRLTFCQKLIIVCVDMSAPHTLILEAARTIVELFRKKKISRHIWRVGQIKKQGDKSVILFVKNENRKTAFVANMNMGLVFHVTPMWMICVEYTRGYKKPHNYEHKRY